MVKAEHKQLWNMIANPLNQHERTAENLEITTLLFTILLQVRSYPSAIKSIFFALHTRPDPQNGFDCLGLYASHQYNLKCCNPHNASIKPEKSTVSTVLSFQALPAVEPSVGSS